MGAIYIKVLLIMSVLFLFMIPGFVLKKTGMIKEGGAYAMSNVLLYVCQPALVINAFCVFSEEDYAVISAVDKAELLKNFGVTALISLIALFATFAICKLVFIKARNKSAADVYSFAAVFSNCGFVGIPFVQMFTDGNPVAVLYMTVFNVVFNVLLWTLGVVLITGSVKSISLKKIFLNPTVLSCAVGLVLFFVPQINPFMINGLKELQILPSYLATTTAPLSMIIVGVRLAETDVKTLFCNVGVYLSGGLRLIASPFLTLLISLPFVGFLGTGAASGFEEYVYLAPIIAMAMSPATAVVAMAEKFGGERECATACVVTNTLLSIITIPLIVTAVYALLGVGI